MGISAIVVAGGKSVRMGSDKTLMTIQNVTLIEKTVSELRKVADEIIIASNDTCKFNIPDIIEIPDTMTGMGPLAGIHAGLSVASFEYSFIASSDMPFFKAELAEFLLQHKDGYDVVVPKINNRFEPLCAVYSKSCLPEIDKLLGENVRHIFKIYQQLKVLTVNESELSAIGKADELLFNMNTPEDYQKVLDKSSFQHKKS